MKKKKRTATKTSDFCVHICDETLGFWDECTSKVLFSVDKTRKKGPSYAPFVVPNPQNRQPLRALSRRHSEPRSNPSSPAQHTNQQALITRAAHHSTRLTIYMYKDGLPLVGSPISHCPIIRLSSATILLSCSVPFPKLIV